MKSPLLRTFGKFLILTVVLLGNAWVNPAFAQDNQNCLNCHQYPLFARISEEDGKLHNFYVDAEMYANSVHSGLACTDCHSDVEKIPHDPIPKPVNCNQACHTLDPFTQRPFSHSGVFEDWEVSVHGPKNDGKDHLRPECKDCHVNPLQLHPVSAEFQKLSENCIKCHEEENITTAVKHVDFHSNPERYWTQQRRLEVCAACHTDASILGEQTDILHDDVVSSFLKSFHGVGFAFGDKKTPVCNDCHDYHGVFPQNDVRSTINEANLRETCSGTGCHANVSRDFIQGSMHFRYEGWQADVLKWVRWIWTTLIIGVIGFMLIHNTMDFIRTRIILKKHGYPPPTRLQKRYARMNKTDRVSHIIMFSSFTGLALTGALLWVPAEQLNWLPDWLYLVEVRFWGHRFFALILTLISLFHIGYAIFTKRGRGLLAEMFPKPSDALHIFQNIAFMLGMRKEPPQMPWFNYAEKMEYWAFAWGSFVMTFTGVVMMLEQLGPKFWVDVARIIHSLEAILAVLAIVVWHFYLVHWKPGKWPMSNVWITGEISEWDMKEEHAGALEQLSKSSEANDA
ncbi:MAG: cytochrome b/b6 domain-containing protein [Lentisphaeria bacterium]|nr:cytochrome b/b6 domain-containing protein [Candidatus Neomarinimicrobiota bacterium]MCF7842277.1 cytochrome b/b6 domain-containing protein [Lentisphaeria bacterium]